MPLDLLDTPLRMTWDLHGPGGALTSGEILALARRLSEGGVFFVILDERPLAHPGILPALEILAEGGSQASVVTTGEAGELRALAPTLPLAQVYLDAAPFLGEGALDSDGLGSALEALRDLGREPVLWLAPWRRFLPALPDLLAFCGERKVGRIKLPNLRISDNFAQSRDGGVPRPRDLEVLRSRPGGIPAIPPGLALEIHDRFLWELLRPEEAVAEGYGGCQAGNSLGHLDERGELHPCSSWPQSLGSLLLEPLEALWRSPRRLALREEIEAVPAGCGGCRDYPLCLGGCRGLSRCLDGEGGRDLLCPGPR